jgi:hypothetical protein
LPGFVERRPRDFYLVRFGERFSDSAPVGQFKSIRHRATDENRIGFVEERVDHHYLIRHLCPAEDDDKRARWLLQFFTQKLQFLSP